MKFDVENRGINEEWYWNSIHSQKSKEWMEREPEFVEKFLQKEWIQYGTIFKDLEKENVKTFLEIGCGIGEALAFFAKSFPQIEFKGIDFTNSFLEHTKKKFKYNNLSFEKRDILNNFIEDEHDAIAILEVLEHIETPTNFKVLEELLKKCKILYISIPATLTASKDSEHISAMGINSFDEYNPLIKQEINNMYFIKLRGIL
jgi:2-polyprenyl-3-methyl-5-hydroxy-6-metoxy-1,4-benzoquinol methylase